MLADRRSRPSDTPPMTATVTDPDGVNVTKVSARSQRALDAGVRDVLLYRLDEFSGIAQKALDTVK